VSAAELQQQLDFAIEIRDRTSDANEAVMQIRDVKAQIKERLEQSKNPRLKEIGDVVTQKLSQVEEEIYQVRNRSGQDPLNFPIKINNRLAALRRSVETGDAAPTDGSREIYKLLSAELQKQLDALAAVTKGDLANFNKAAAQQKLTPVAAQPVERAK
jgi:stress-induced morphogen